MGCLHDLSNVKQTSSKCIQNTRANAGSLLDCVNTLLGNVVSAIVFWPVSNEVLTSTAFLLICLAIYDNIMITLYYLLVGIPNTCIFYDTCQHFMKVNDPQHDNLSNGKGNGVVAERTIWQRLLPNFLAAEKSSKNA